MKCLWIILLTFWTGYCVTPFECVNCIKREYKWCMKDFDQKNFGKCCSRDSKDPECGADGDYYCSNDSNFEEKSSFFMCKLNLYACNKTEHFLYDDSEPFNVFSNFVVPRDYKIQRYQESVKGVKFSNFNFSFVDLELYSGDEDANFKYLATINETFNKTFDFEGSRYLIILALHRGLLDQFGSVSFTVESEIRESFGAGTIVLIVFGTILFLVVIGIVLRVCLKPFKQPTNYRMMTMEQPIVRNDINNTLDTGDSEVRKSNPKAKKFALMNEEE